ncbi:type II toxin-antitoxin system HipA family toxin [Vibrio splendidus]|nr:type II toxin-antitoxin system HipA family toxin [Vibrio splendidus]MCC4882754.1 type II toxin-antitoxin system HipA family toxin [Vibrio splendidus]
MVEILHAYMNGVKVGVLEKRCNGVHYFTYDADWLSHPLSRPVSISMPCRQDPYVGEVVVNFFQNLLPDSQDTIANIASQFNAKSRLPFDLLTHIGRDTVGAITLVPNGCALPDHKVITGHALSEQEMLTLFNGHERGAPLGMIKGENDLRISISGMQEKTALLRHDGQWMIPTGLTPTTHIIKQPIGSIVSHSSTIDLSSSVDNELICMRLAKAFGLSAADCDIIRIGGARVLSVERFDRRLSLDGTHYLRLPQEDLCQALELAPCRKYESDSGYGINDVISVLRYSKSPSNTLNFARSQVLFWLLAAIDGHAKNFSISIEARGRYQLTPLYDIMSAYPLIGGRGLSERKIRMAMSLKGSKGRKWKWHQIQPRHLVDTFSATGIPSINEQRMRVVLNEFALKAQQAIDIVGESLPSDIDEDVRDKIFSGLLKASKKIKIIS